MKRMLDYFENGLEKLLEQARGLKEEKGKNELTPAEFKIIEKALLLYPTEIIETQRARIEDIKEQIDAVGVEVEKNQIKK